MKVYEFANGVQLRVLNGEGLGDDPDAPIPYVPFDVTVVDPTTAVDRVVELERLLEQSRETEKVWQEVAQQLQERCERALADIATLTGRSRAAVRAHYVPEVLEAHLDSL